MCIVPALASGKLSPVALLSPAAAMATGKLSPVTAINPALGLYKTMKRKDTADASQPAQPSTTFGPGTR